MLSLHMTYIRVKGLYASIDTSYILSCDNYKITISIAITGPISSGEPLGSLGNVISIVTTFNLRLLPASIQKTRPWRSRTIHLKYESHHDPTCSLLRFTATVEPTNYFKALLEPWCSRVIFRCQFYSAKPSPWCEHDDVLFAHKFYNHTIAVWSTVSDRCSATLIGAYGTSATKRSSPQQSPLFSGRVRNVLEILRVLGSGKTMLKYVSRSIIFLDLFLFFFSNFLTSTEMPNGSDSVTDCDGHPEPQVGFLLDTMGSEKLGCEYFDHPHLTDFTAHKRSTRWLLR